MMDPPVPPRGLWRRRDFRLLIGAQGVTHLGSDIGAVVFPLIAILLLDATPLEMGIVVAIQNSAFLVVGLPAGAWTDRVNRRPVMISADVVRALALATVPLAAALGQLTMAQIYAVAAVTSVGNVFFELAYQSFLPSLVARADLIGSNSKLESVRAAAQAGGPGLGGWLVQLLGASTALLADAVSFVASALLIGAIRGTEPARERGDRPARWADMTDGLRFVVHQPVLRQIALSSAVWNFFLHAAMAVTLLFLSRELALAPVTIGMLSVGASVAALLGAAAAAPLARRVGRGRVIWLSVTVTAPFALLVPLTTRGPGLVLFVLSSVVCTFGQLIFNVSQLSYRQAHCPDRLAGRMNAGMYLIGVGPAPLGGLLGGALASAVGLRPTLWIVGAGLAASCVPLLLPPLVTLRDNHPEPAGTRR